MTFCPACDAEIRTPDYPSTDWPERCPECRARLEWEADFGGDHWTPSVSAVLTWTVRADGRWTAGPLHEIHETNDPEDLGRCYALFLRGEGCGIYLTLQAAKNAARRVCA